MRKITFILIFLGWVNIGSQDLFAGHLDSEELYVSGMEAFEMNNCDDALSDLNFFLFHNESALEETDLKDEIQRAISWCQEYLAASRGSGGGGGKADCVINCLPEPSPSFSANEKPSLRALQKH